MYVYVRGFMMWLVGFSLIPFCSSHAGERETERGCSREAFRMLGDHTHLLGRQLLSFVPWGKGHWISVQWKASCESELRWICYQHGIYHSKAFDQAETASVVSTIVLARGDWRIAIHIMSLLYWSESLIEIFNELKAPKSYAYQINSFLLLCC